LAGGLALDPHVLELRVASRMRRALVGIAVALPTVADANAYEDRLADGDHCAEPTPGEQPSMFAIPHCGLSEA